MKKRKDKNYMFTRKAKNAFGKPYNFRVSFVTYLKHLFYFIITEKKEIFKKVFRKNLSDFST